jgi:hypothetical protein
VKLHDAKSALLFRCIFREYHEVVANSDIEETLINFGDKNSLRIVSVGFNNDTVLLYISS